MNKLAGFHQCCLAADCAAEAVCSASEGSCFFATIRQLIRAEIDIERARVAAEESEQWERAFAASGPANLKTRNDPVIRVASARALLAHMNRPPAYERGGKNTNLAAAASNALKRAPTSRTGRRAVEPQVAPNHGRSKSD